MRILYMRFHAVMRICDYIFQIYICCFMQICAYISAYIFVIIGALNTQNRVFGARILVRLIWSSGVSLQR